MSTILLFFVGIGLGMLFRPSKESPQYAINQLKSTIIRLDEEEKVIQKRIKQGKFKGRKLAERKEVIKTYRQKLYDYIWCLKNISYLGDVIQEIWNRRKGDYSADYSATFKKKNYCQKCGSLYN